MKRNDLSRSLVAFDQATTLVAVVELSRGRLVGDGSCSSSDPTTLEEATVRSGGAAGIAVAMARPGNQSRRPDQTDCAGMRRAGTASGWPAGCELEGSSPM
jgi:hypothetical protein